MSSNYRFLWFGLACMSVFASCSRPASEDASSITSGSASQTIEERLSHLYEQVPSSEGAAHEARLADQFAALGSRAIPALERHLRSSEPREPIITLIALSRLNHQRRPTDFSTEMVQRYLVMLSDDNVMVRTYAMESLIRAGARFKSTMLAYRTGASADVQQRLDIVLEEMTGQ